MGSTSYARKPHSESPLNQMWPAYWSSKAALNMQVGPCLVQQQLLRPKQQPMLNEDLCWEEIRCNASALPMTISTDVKGCECHAAQYGNLHLCMQVAILSNDLLEEKFTIVALHPGWVQTGQP